MAIRSWLLDSSSATPVMLLLMSLGICRSPAPQNTLSDPPSVALYASASMRSGRASRIYLGSASALTILGTPPSLFGKGQMGRANVGSSPWFRP